jgi:hypothetical protein
MVTLTKLLLFALSEVMLGVVSIQNCEMQFTCINVQLKQIIQCHLNQALWTYITHTIITHTITQSLYFTFSKLVFQFVMASYETQARSEKMQLITCQFRVKMTYHPPL